MEDINLRDDGEINLTLNDSKEFNFYFDQSDMNLKLVDESLNITLDSGQIDLKMFDDGDLNIKLVESGEINVSLEGVSLSGTTSWGAIGGTLSDQTDLQEALDLKFDISDFNTYFDSQFALKDTGDLSEGTNLYYTESRVSSNSNVVLNTAHRTSNGNSHSNVVLNNAHRLTLSGNPHNVTLSDVGGTSDHTLLTNIGVKTHLEIDSHIADTSIHFSDLSGFDTDGLSEGSTNLYDRTVILTEGSNVTITGTYPSFTISSTDSGTSNHADLSNLDYANAGHTGFQATLSEGTGIDISGTTISVDMSDFDTDDLTEGTTNLYDKTVTLNDGAGISVSGTYPDFTIASTITQYTDEMAQDAVGTILSNEFTYNDLSPNIALNYTNISHTALQDIGINTHTQIDSHIVNSSIHFEMLDEDDLSSNSDTKTATQQSIKSYVDTAVSVENLWDRTGTILSPHTSGDDITTTGKLAIGFLIAPTFGVQIAGATQNDASIATQYFGNDTTAPFLGMIKYRGVITSPLAVASGDSLGDIYFAGWDGVDVGIGATVTGQSTQAWTATHQGSKLTFRVVENDTVTRGNALMLDQDKSATFYGGMTVTPFNSAGFVKNTAGGVLSGGNSIDISNDTNLAVVSPVILTNDTISLSGLTGFGTSGQVIKTNATTNGLEWGDGGSTIPAGFDKNIQYNDSGAFGGESSFTWDKTLNHLFIDGTATFTNNLEFAHADARKIEYYYDENRNASSLYTAIYYDYNVTCTANSDKAYRGHVGVARWKNTYDLTGDGEIVGVQASAQHRSSGTLANVKCFTAKNSGFETEAGTGTITDAYGFLAEDWWSDLNGTHGTGTITNLYGFYAQELTAGTNNYEVFIEGGGEIFFRDSAISIGSLNDGYLDLTADTQVRITGDTGITGTLQAGGYKSSDGTSGATGSFVDNNGNTVTVKNGLITSFS